MSKSRPFSIFLLKQNFDYTNCLKEENNLEEQDCDFLPPDAKFYLLDSKPTPPWWRQYFGINKELTQVLKGAIVFIPVEMRWFAITFGHVSHNLKEESYEYDFGIRITLNSVDSLKLKSLDMVEPASSKRQRIQLPSNSDLTYFDFDRDNTILKSLTGNVKDQFKHLFKHSTGSHNIRISSDRGPQSLQFLCKELLTLYQDDSYIEEFPQINNIAPIKDPTIIHTLNENLVAEIKTKNHAIILAFPELIDYKEGFYTTFSGEGAGQIHDDLEINLYYEYLKSRNFDFNNMDIDTLKKHHLCLTNGEGVARGVRLSVYKSLLFDIKLANQTYHLCEGNWYLVDRNFVTELNTYLDKFCKDTLLPPFNHEDEGHYNKECAHRLSSSFLCLDKGNISPRGQSQIEPCDILEINGEIIILHHVKRSTSSSSLSHLFNQGLNSIRLIRSDDDAYDNLKKKILGSNLESKNNLNLSSEQKFKVSFQIITSKEQNGLSHNLPLFSRISLKRTIKELSCMGIDAEFCFVKDEKPTMSVKKPRKKRRTNQEG
ncbi:DUF6119 family protein [Legionella dresdenensis]|uniref:DUF6119 family protein n=1 Tax=Legionella dresdenensis TaxID=450200 RepID=A0ABV8CGC6_9GAMM